MCKIVEELNKQTAIEIARKLITNGKLSFEEIALCSGRSVEEVKKLAEGESA